MLAQLGKYKQDIRVASIKIGWDARNQKSNVEEGIQNLKGIGKLAWLITWPHKSISTKPQKGHEGQFIHEALSTADELGDY